MMQFGSGYANTPKGLANFKTNFRLRLNEALLFYPGSGTTSRKRKTT